MTEQGAIQQAEGGARLFCPQRQHGAGNVLRQALWADFQTEQLAGRGFRRTAAWQSQTAAEGLQPLSVAPGQPYQQAKAQAPEQALHHKGQAAAALPPVE
uniref:leucine zipper domain-containing protein n=1 Tax=Pseudomonas fluvialis TaxID=1793966 RepID=UPI0035AF4CF9